MKHNQARTKRVLFATALAAALLLPPVAFAAPSIDDGEWEFSMQMEMPGMPVNMSPLRFSNCLTKNDPIPKQEGKGSSGCKVVDQDVKGDSVSYTMRCSQGDMIMENKGQSTFYGNNMEGTVHQTMKQGGKVMHTSTAKMTAKRIGPCKK
jgi:hypothetical protein